MELKLRKKYSSAYHIVTASDSQYQKFEPLLSDGWIPGRKVVGNWSLSYAGYSNIIQDNSDSQYAAFRENIPYMALVVILHPLLRKLYNFFTVKDTQSNSKPESLGEARLKQRVTFDIAFATIFLIVLHGFSALKVFLILYCNYKIAKKVPRKHLPFLTWFFNIAILFANELFKGYPYAKIVAFLSLSVTESSRSTRNWGTWLDNHGGLVPRWEILFNITVLRLISFNLDYYWSLDYRSGDPVEVSSFTRCTRYSIDRFKKKQISESSLSERDRINTPASSESYSFANYYSYSLYSPLYLAGPILTFNDYISQLRYPPPSITTRRTILYAVRFLITLLSMEVIIHYIYAVAISKSDPDWSHYSPFQLSMLGYFSLHHIWLKLLLPWRFFRLWALLDNIDPPENMVRCMSDNYSAMGFWRNWHRSFNRWIIRYVYVPLGGSGRSTSVVRSIANLLAVFTFVALWHDISLRLLTWSWLIVLFLLPEIICTMVIFPARAYKNRPNTFRIISGIGGVANVLMMMAANLVGFAVGLDGLQGLVRGIVSGWEGWAFLGTACATLFVGVMVMFEIREDERRRGIVMKC